MKKSIKEIGCTFKQFQSMPSGKIHPMLCYAATKKGITKIEELNSKNSTCTTIQNGSITVQDVADLEIADFKNQFIGVDVPDVETHVKVILITKPENLTFF